METIICSKENAAELWQIEKESFASPIGEAAFTKMLDDPYTCALALKENELLAFVIYEKVLDEGQIVSVAVKETHRKKGLGTKLIEAMVEHGKRDGISRFTLEVREDNTPARALYKKCGFVEVGVRPGYYDKPMCSAILMDLEMT